MQRTLTLLGLGLVCFLTAAGRGGAWRGTPTPTLQRRVIEPAALTVLDGDTLLIDGERLRLLAVDTPERAAPWFVGDQEPWASEASAFVERALAQAERIEVLSWNRRGPYGRQLGHVLLDGDPLAAQLAEAGLAWETVSHYGDSGFPDLAERVLQRAKTPAFEAPVRWRRAHRR